MKKLSKIAIALVLIIIGGYFSFKYIFNNLNYGLDLIGGFEVLYKVDSLDTNEKLTNDMLNATAKSLINRIDTLGVSEPVVRVEGDKVRVQLAGVTNIESARERLSTPAVLTFRDTSDNIVMTSDVLVAGGAKLDYQNAEPVVALKIQNNKAFAAVTEYISKKASPDNKIVIWLDFKDGLNSYKKEINCGTSANQHCISAATVSRSFASDVIIQGNFTEKAAQNLVDLINSGSLPTKLTEISSKNVDADFGANTLNSTYIAGIIAIGLIIIFLCSIYHVAGFITSISLLIYTALVFWIFYLIEGVLTLPGIAALIIGLGMAVDASVISYSRIKDELKAGSTLEKAFNDGKKNSYSSIIDGNLTTLVVAIIMYIFGESSVKGFATMLIISIIITMLAIVLINNILMKLFIKTGLFNNKLNLFINYKNKAKEFKKFSVTSLKKYIYGFYIILTVVGVVSLFTNGLKLGIDFTGGSSISVVSDKNINLDSIKTILTNDGYKINNANLLNSDKEAYITIEQTLNDKQVSKVNTSISKAVDGKCSISGIDDIVKKQLVKNAIYSIILGCIGIIIYVTFRFKFNYGVSGLAALFLDVWTTITVFSLFKLEINVIFIAAILAIIGYSINDTIVIFDRIRENNAKTKDINESIDLSVNQTLIRNIYTSVTTIIAVITLLFVSSNEIANFNIAMLIGLVEGVISSLFFAPCLLSDLEKIIHKKKKENVKKKVRRELDEMSVKGINS